MVCLIEHVPVVMQNIESELKERLKKGVYGDIYNYPFKEFDTILEMEKDDVAPAEEEEEVSIVTECRLAHLTLHELIHLSWIHLLTQEEVEYVEGDDEMDDMEDIEDFGGLPDDEDDDDNDGNYFPFFRFNFNTFQSTVMM